MVILIMDDSPDEQELLSIRLRTAGYESPLVADSAEAALGILGQVETGEKTGGVDLILMDIMLPGRTAWKRAAELLQLSGSRISPSS